MDLCGHSWEMRLGSEKSWCDAMQSENEDKKCIEKSMMNDETKDAPWSIGKEKSVVGFAVRESEMRRHQSQRAREFG